MAEALHHQHTRKRVYQNLEPYPHDDRLKHLVDRLIYFVALFSVVMTIPQIVNIWVEHDASGVSPLSWGAYSLGAFVWCVYGILHKEKPLIMIYGLILVMDLVIVVGTVIYG